MKTYSLTKEEFSETINISKTVYLRFLREQDIITTEQFRDLQLNTALIVEQPSFFSKMWSKLGWKDIHKRPMVIVVRQHTMEIENG